MLHSIVLVVLIIDGVLGGFKVKAVKKGGHQKGLQSQQYHYSSYTKVHKDHEDHGGHGNHEGSGGHGGHGHDEGYDLIQVGGGDDEHDVHHGGTYAGLSFDVTTALLLVLITLVVIIATLVLTAVVIPSSNQQHGGGGWRSLTSKPYDIAETASKVLNAVEKLNDIHQ